jgi:hypothetical protein
VGLPEAERGTVASKAGGLAPSGSILAQCKGEANLARSWRKIPITLKTPSPRCTPCAWGRTDGASLCKGPGFINYDASSSLRRKVSRGTRREGGSSTWEDSCLNLWNDLIHIPARDLVVAVALAVLFALVFAIVVDLLREGLEFVTLFDS